MTDFEDIGYVIYKQDEWILKMLLEGDSYRTIQSTLKVGTKKVKEIRDANIQAIIKAIELRIPKKKVKSTRIKSSKKKEVITTKDFITPEEKSHLRKCLVAGNHIRSFTKSDMVKALEILDKL